MLSIENHDHLHLPQKCLKIEKDDKFFSRLLSKESPMQNPSFNYGSRLSGAVPFLWESQPGTPKHTFSDNTLPPLTPPPSYYNYYSKKKPNNKLIYSKSNLLHTLFTKIKLKKKTQTQLSSSFWSSSDSSSTVAPSHHDHRYSSPTTSFEEDIDYEQGVNAASSTFTCFGFARNMATKFGGKQSCKR